MFVRFLIQILFVGTFVLLSGCNKHELSNVEKPVLTQYSGTQITEASISNHFGYPDLFKQTLNSNYQTLGTTTVVRDFNHDSKERTYSVYTPKKLRASAHLVFVLHARGQAHNAGHGLGFNKDADESDGKFILVYPEALEDYTGVRSWDHNLSDRADDVGFLGKLAGHLQASMGLSGNHYVIGFSEGGAMTYTWMCDSKNKLSAVAVVSGLMWNHAFNQCDFSAANLVHYHGEADINVDASKGMLEVDAVSRSPTLQQHLDKWRLILNAGSVLQSTNGVITPQTTYYNERAYIVYNDIRGIDHAWPKSSIFQNKSDLSTNILTFFQDFGDF